jgi:uncharacterized protein
VALRPAIPHLPILLAGALLLLSGCGASPPPNLYLLSSAAPVVEGKQASAQAGSEIGAGSSRSGASAGPVIGVVATVPPYLDRRDIVVRTGANEVKAMDNDRWADDLSVNVTRAIADDLAALRPSGDVVMLPSYLGQTIDYEVRVDLTKFDIDSDGNTTIAGRWSIADAGRGGERASRRILRSERVTQSGFSAMAATMSRNLAAVSAEIAAALAALPPRSPGKG